MQGVKVRARRIMDWQTRLPLFIQFIITYVLILLIMFSALMQISSRAHQIAQQNYLNQRQYALDVSAKSLDRQLKNFQKIPLSMDQTTHYSEMRLLERASLTNRHYYLLSKLCDLYRQQSYLLEMPNVSFLLFTRNNTVLAGDHFYIDAAECFEKYLRFAGTEQGWQALKETEPSALLPVQAVSVAGAAYRDYLLYLYRYRDESALYGMMLETSELRSLFRLQELPEDTFFTIADLDGSFIYGHNTPKGAEGDTPTHVVLHANGENLSYAFSLGIPLHYFAELVAPISALNGIFIAIALSIGLLCSFLFTIGHLRPVRHLLRISSEDKGGQRVRNEYLALRQNIQQSMTKNQRLMRQIGDSKLLLRANLLTRLLVQESYSHQDEALAAEYLPQLKGSCRTLCLRLDLGDDHGDGAMADLVCYRMLEELSAMAKPYGLLAQISDTLFALLIVEADCELTTIGKITASMNSSMGLLGASVSAGVSEGFTSLEKLHGAYQHALFSMRRADEETLSVFQAAQPLDDATELFLFRDLHRLHHAVQTGEAAQAERLLTAMLEAVHVRAEADADALRLPYAFLFVLDSIREDMHLPLDPHVTRAPLLSHAFVAIMTDLQSRLQAVLSALELKQNQGTQLGHFASRVLAYVREHYGDVSLSITGISAQFHVSKSYLYRAMKDTTGLMLSECIEQIRMEKAVELLSTTSMSIADIADSCGYSATNTFHKAFKKRHGISPSAMRMKN